MAYCPEQGDLIWLTFDPQSGHEQAGRRPAIVLSALRYNQRTAFCLACPITSRIKGYGFEVHLPDGAGVNGVVLADQIKCLDWRSREAAFISAAPPEVVDDVLAKLATLLS